MKTKKEILEILEGSSKDKEKALNINIRNGQALEGIKKALKWVLEETK